MREHTFDWCAVIVFIIAFGYATLIDKEISRQRKEIIRLEHQAEEAQKLAENPTERELLYMDMQHYVHTKYPKIKPADIDKIVYCIDKYGFEYGVPPVLILAVIETESRFKVDATSKAKARGLMQIMPVWVSHFDFLNSKEDLYNIDKNIRAGAKVLKIYMGENNTNIIAVLNDYSDGSISYARAVFYSMSRFTLYRMSKMVERESENSNRSDGESLPR